MKLFESETKRNFVYLVVITSILSVAFEVAFLSKLYPENAYNSGFLFVFFASIGMIGCFYYYQKAKKEDKLKEGL